MILTKNRPYKVVITSSFKNQLKIIKKQNKNLEELEIIVDLLTKREKIPDRYKVHKLKDDKKFKNCFELHIRPDWLLIYQYNDNELILLLIETGSHSDLFK